MKTYEKLPIQIIDWVEQPQLYKITETTKVVIDGGVSRDNYINRIAQLEQSKIDFAANVDVQIAEQEAILAELDNLPAEKTYAPEIITKTPDVVIDLDPVTPWTGELIK